MIPIVVFLLWTWPLAVNCLRCYQCSFVNTPSSCSHITECSQDEQCFTERRYDGFLKEYYTMGCVSNDFCQDYNNDIIVGKKRNTDSSGAEAVRYKREAGCLQCCTTDICNTALCADTVFSGTEIRLINGTNTRQGTVEIWYNNTWYRVCDNHWDTKEASVACQWLGYSRYGSTAIVSNSFLSDSGQGYLLDDVHCLGNETRLTDCIHGGLLVSNCAHGQEAGVICSAALFPNNAVIFFLDAKTHKIIKMDLQLQTYSFINVPSAYIPGSFDYDATTDEFYFYDNHLKKILHMRSDGNNLRLLLQLDYNSDVYTIKVDSMNGIVFYSDDGLNVIGSFYINGGNHSIFRSSSPRAIALHPTSKVVYWSNWGLDPNIESANYNGSNRRTLVSSNTVKWPSSLAIDFQENRLYFVDGGTQLIQSIDLGDLTIRTILQETSHLRSLDLIGSNIYYTAINRSTPFRVHKDGSNNIPIGTQHFGELTEIIGYKYGTDNLGQEIDFSLHKIFFRLMSSNDATSGPIEMFINGQWRTMCSTNTWTDSVAKVACHMLGFDRHRSTEANFPLDGSLVADTLSCTGHENNIVDCNFTPQNWYLDYCPSRSKAGVSCEYSDPNLDYRLDDFLTFINETSGGLIRMDLNSYSYTVIPLNNSAGVVPTAVTYDNYYQIFYVAHVNRVSNTSTITEYNTRGKPVRTLSNVPAGSIIDSLALDTRRNMLYYADTRNSLIGFISTTGSIMSTFATNVDHPGGIALDKRNLVMYWTEGGASPKVVKMNLDDTDRTILAGNVSNVPKGIAVDHAAQLVYFCNTGQHNIEVMSTDGSNRRILFSDPLGQLQGLTITSKYIFYTDLRRRTIRRLNRDGTNITSVGTGDFLGVYNIYAFESSFL